MNGHGENGNICFGMTCEALLIVIVNVGNAWITLDRKRVRIMDITVGRQSSHNYRMALIVALFAVPLILAMSAEAIPPPTRPYTVTRSVENWAYNAGETLDVAMRITTNTTDLANMLYMNIAEGFSPTPEAWEFVALYDSSGRVAYTPPQPGVNNTHNFAVNLQGDFPDVLEFNYAMRVPADVTGLVRITASFLIEAERQDTPVHPLVVTDLYPPGLPEIDNSDGVALDNYVSQLRQQGTEEGWTFEVDNNGIIIRDSGALLGTVLDYRPAEKDLKILTFPKVDPKALPEKFDWREQSLDVPVSDQGNCGSCWAFALVGIAERLVAAKDGVVVKFSEQWVLDCNPKNWNCNGGWNPYEMFIGADYCGEEGLVLGAVLPYAEVELSCECGNPRTNPYAFSYEGTIDEGLPFDEKVAAIKQAIMNFGPVWTTVHAGTTPFLAYSGGVFNYKPASGGIDHAVVIEGWDDTRGTNGVWILRNSWSNLWGDDGYMYIEYDSSLVGSYTDVMSYAGSPNGSVQVTLEPAAAVNAGAQWSIDGGTTWLNSGDTSPNMVPGNYTVTFKSVSGFTAPESIAVVLAEQENKILVGEYTVPTEGETEGEDTEGELETLEDIAAFLLEQYEKFDTNNNSRLRLEEAQEAIPDFSENQFELLDTDGDGFITREELQAIIDGPAEPACCGSGSKSASLKERIKDHLGDWLLLGMTLLVLLSVTSFAKTR